MRTPLPLLLALPVALLWALPLFACQSDGPPDLTKEQKLGIYYENALRYFELRDLERTAHQCRKALELDPGNERFLLILGNVHLRRGTTEDILQALNLFERHPNQDDYRVHLGKGEAHERLAVLEHESAEAIESGEKFTEAEDITARVRELRESARENLQTASLQFHAAEDIHAGELNAVNGLLRTYALLGEDEKSIEWSRRLIEVLRASTHLRRTELEDPEIHAARESELVEQIRRNTDLIVKTHFHVASLLRRMGRLQEAAEELGRVVALDPQASLAYSRRGQLLLELGQYLEAKEALEKFIQLEARRPFEDPEIRAAYDMLAECEAALEGELAGGV